MTQRGEIELRALFYISSMMVVLLSIVLSHMIIPSTIEELYPLLYKKPDVNPLKILVVGLDKRIENTTRTDVIILAFVDVKTKNITMTSVPRDLRYGRGKINSVYGRYGISGLKRAIKEITGFQMDRYAVFDYESFKLLGDELGPIKVRIEKPMIYYDYAQGLKIDFRPGVHELRGSDLLAYVRYRKGGMGDLDRIERQKYVLMKLMSKAMKRSIKDLVRIYSELMEYVKTDLELGELVYLILNFRSGFKVRFISFPYDINVDGQVTVDPKELIEFKHTVLHGGEISKDEERILKIAVLNNSNRESPSFYDKTRRIWRERAGFTPHRVFWERPWRGLEGNHIFVVSSGKEKRIEETARKVYPNRNFTVHSMESESDTLTYYSMISELSKARIYLSGKLDAIFLVGDVNIPPNPSE